jgi:DDE superfamily endonuclease
MLTGAGLSRTWAHHRAHYFFARARWNPDDLGLAVARLAVSLLVSAGEPVTAAIDGTLFRRCGKKVFISSPSARSPGGEGFLRRGHVADEGPAGGEKPKSGNEKSG